MQRLDRLSQLPRIADPAIRAWMAERWRGVLEAGAEACFILLSPAEPPLAALWSACVGEAADPPGVGALDTLIEYVVDHGDFFELVVMANHEAALIVAMPKSDQVEPALADYLRQAALPTVNPTEAPPHPPLTGVHYDATRWPVAGDPQPAPYPSRCDPGPGRVGAEGDQERHPTAGAGTGADQDQVGEAAVSAPHPAAVPAAPLFTLGRLVATPHALKVLEAHGVQPLSLLQRHVRGDWGELCSEDVQANQEALQDGFRLFSSYLLNADVKVWVITEADRSVTTLLMPEDY